jgi:Raf kinase inhibitor-like YbhB/YbcL family protein
MSPEFGNDEFIPAKFTCEGEDISPALVIEDIPKNAQSLVLIVDDPDAPMGTWVHWVVYNIPIVSRIDEDAIPGRQGINNFGIKDYGGPCPPSGTHRYFFKIYALDKMLDLDGEVDKKDLEEQMQEHILDNAQLIGLYRKGR